MSDYKIIYRINQIAGENADVMNYLEFGVRCMIIRGRESEFNAT